MKKRHSIHLLLAAAALLLATAACNNDNPGSPSGGAKGAPVIIQASGLDVTATPVSRATVDGDWQGVSSVALQIGDEVKEYTVTASDADGYRSATLSRTADPFYWTSRDTITVSAWWPLDDTDITQMPDVKVAGNQSTLAAFAASDFISAIDQTVEFDDPTLEFTHRTARVSIELKPGTGFTSVAGATVSLVSLSADNGNPTAITACNTEDDTYEALAAPQTVAAGEPFIQVVLGDGAFYFRPQSYIELAAGSSYTYNVRVNATGLTLEGSTIGGWEPGQGEEGTAEDLGYIYDEATHTYFVHNAKGLLAWNEAVQKDMSLNCTLIADITLPKVAEGESNWTPMGTDSNPYTGTFEGGGHTITGLTVDLPNQNNVGLIGYLGNGGKVQNLTLAEVKINGSYHVGGVVGATTGTVTACTVSGDVSGSDYVGGVAGFNASGTVTACYATGNVTGTIYVGGVMGYNDSGTVTGCTVSGNVTGADAVGGVVGINVIGTVTGCTVSGNVTGADAVGGVAGRNVTGTVTACTVLGNVTGDSNVGGVVGLNNDTVTACYATGNVSGTGFFVGGVVGLNDDTVTACYWNNSLATGIGDDDVGDATKVDGSTTWQTAQSGMNEAIDAWNKNNPDKQCNWHYAKTDAETPPTLEPIND